MRNFFRQNRFIILTLFVILILRLPSLFEPYWYGDEGIYLTIGMAIRKGFLLYRDIFDNKPPLFYLLPVIANGTLFWFRFMLLTSVLTTIYFFYRLVQKLFLKKETLVRVATVLFALLITFRYLEGNIANAEIFILLPTITGLFLVFKNEKISPLNALCAGSILGLGLILKPPALFDFLALMVFLVLFNGKKLINIGKREIFLIAGYILPFLAVCLFFWIKGSFNIFFSSSFIQTVGYLSSWKTGSHAFSLVALLKTDLIIKGVIVACLLFIFWLLRKRLSGTVSFIFIWLSFSLFGATLSGRPYPHYLIQLVPSFVLLVGLFFARKEKIILAFSGVLILLCVLAVNRYQFWSYPTLSYYQNYLQFIFRQKSKNEYFSYFGKNVPQLYELAGLINKSTLPGDKIFIWADEPSLYALSQRLPATPYLVAYHIRDLNFEDQAITKLKESKTSLIVIDQRMKTFLALESLTEKNYLEIETIGTFTVFLKKQI